MNDVLGLNTTIAGLLRASAALRGVTVISGDDKDAFVKFATAMAETGLVIFVAAKAGKVPADFNESPMLVDDRQPVVEIYENLALNRGREVITETADLAARLALTGILPRQIVKQLDTGDYWWLLDGDGSSEAHWAPFINVFSAQILACRLLHFADSDVLGARLFVTDYNFGPGFKTDTFEADLDCEINLVSRVTYDTAEVGAATATEFAESAKSPLAVGVDVAEITFSVPKSGTYHFVELAVHAPDGTAQSIGLWAIQETTADGFKLLLSGAPKVPGFQLWWKVEV
jgi:hypothetical protein